MPSGVRDGRLLRTLRGVVRLRGRGEECPRRMTSSGDAQRHPFTSMTGGLGHLPSEASLELAALAERVSELLECLALLVECGGTPRSSSRDTQVWRMSWKRTSPRPAGFLMRPRLRRRLSGSSGVPMRGGKNRSFSCQSGQAFERSAAWRSLCALSSSTHSSGSGMVRSESSVFGRTKPATLRGMISSRTAISSAFLRTAWMDWTMRTDSCEAQHSGLGCA